MKRLGNRRELSDAAEAGEGICLNCWEVQDFLEPRLRLGLCHVCGEQRVLPAEEAEEVARLLDALGD